MMPIDEQDAAAVVRAFRNVARRLVAISSGDVYRAYGFLHHTEPGTPEPLPLREDAPLRRVLYPYRARARDAADWMYHYDKILVEQAVMSDPALPGTVLRLPMVYGPRDGGRVRPYLQRMDDHRAFILLGQRQARWRFQQGYVENVAQAIALAITDDRAAGRIYNIGWPGTPTTAQWVRRIADQAGWSGRIITLPDEHLLSHLRMEVNYAQDIVYNTSRIRTELGYQESISAAKALVRTIAWERAHPTGLDPEKFNYAAEDAALRMR
jgi:nucleoside-diphosphate-sugar epimerase